MLVRTAPSSPSGRLITAVAMALSIFGCSCPSKAPEPDPDPVVTGGTTGGSSSAGTGGTQGGSTGATSGTSGKPESITPLPKSTLIFLKAFARPASTFAYHFYSYDLESRQERLITELDDNGKDGFSISGQLSISPDRKWIAFGSRDFRKTPEDGLLIKRGGILWAVSVDGRQFRRLTPPIKEPLHEAGYCGTSGSVCGYGETCSAGRCIRPQLTVQYLSPVWAADGQTVYFEEQHSWVCGTLNSPRACIFALIGSVRDNQITHAKSADSCISDAPVALNPAQGILLVQRHACPKTEMSGLHEWSPDSLTEKRQILAYTDASNSHLNGQTNASTWLPDGSSILAAVQRGPKTPPSRDYLTELVQISASGEVKTLFKPAAETQDVEDVTVSSTGQVVLQISQTTGDQKSSQLYSFDLASSSLGPQLTQSGDNRSPAF
jgi:hypothetical protein